MKEALTRLLKVKSIISILLIITFCVLAVTGALDGGSVKEVTLMVIAFYFGTQSNKSTGGENND